MEGIKVAVVEGGELFSVPMPLHSLSCSEILHNHTFLQHNCIFFHLILTHTDKLQSKYFITFASQFSH